MSRLGRVVVGRTMRFWSPLHGRDVDQRASAIGRRVPASGWETLRRFATFGPGASEIDVLTYITRNSTAERQPPVVPGFSLPPTPGRTSARGRCRDGRGRQRHRRRTPPPDRRRNGELTRPRVVRDCDWPSPVGGTGRVGRRDVPGGATGVVSRSAGPRLSKGV